VTTGTLVDSNVLLDIFTEDTTWFEWSHEALGVAAEAGPLYINPVIYAEVSVRFSRVEDIEDALPSTEFRRAPLPWTAAFLAGKAFLSYRRNQGAASSPLPDFFIGAHAAVDDLALLTRDTRRYRTYFPTVELFAPEDC
jgi:predicted nucleic acid-binding protein